eukprot:TRINITY_DN78351_c0_g1_i1.p1 TRINITY_DN78351_c0_g1~~TRINITY_DN78351_c0_g1_i1.p1  ORF type:complete len:177 (-),score=38.32 TRINITY_DN78351_c0_g1_i1:188-691(-)
MAAVLRALLLVCALQVAEGFSSPSLPASMRQGRETIAPSRGTESPSAEQGPAGQALASFRPLALGALLGLLLTVTTIPAARAVDLSNGEKVFTNVCVACHAGGNNLVVPEKTLKKDALKKYGVDLNKVKAIVAGGQNVMPAFGQLLGPEQIEDVANYVIGQSEKGWP